DMEAAFQQFWQDTRERYRLAQGDPERPVLPPEALFLDAEDFYRTAKPHAQLAFRASSTAAASQNQPDAESSNAFAEFDALPTLTVVRGANDPLARLHAHIAATPQRVLLLAESDGRR